MNAPIIIEIDDVKPIKTLRTRVVSWLLQTICSIFSNDALIEAI